MAPNRVYPSRAFGPGLPPGDGEVPSVLERFLAHGIETVLGLGWVIIGGAFTLEGLPISVISISPTGVFPAPLSFLIAAGLFVSAAVLLWSIFTTSQRLDRVWTIRKLGYYAASLSAGTMVIFTIRIIPLEIFAIILGSINLIASSVGMYVTIRAERSTRFLMREQGYEA